MRRIENSLVFLCILFEALVKADYEVPEVLVEAFSPNGFKVSIPDEDGISLFAFHGKINEEMNGRAAGKYSDDIIDAIDGRWVFRDKTARLKVGDKIYFWVKIVYDDGNGKRDYIKDDQVFVIKDLIVDETISTSATTTTTTYRPSTTRVTTTTRPTTTTTSTTESSQCKDTPTVVNGKPSCQGKLVFEENFETFPGLRWRPIIRFAGDPDYEFVIYQDNEENVYVQKHLVHPVNEENVYVHKHLLHIGPTLTERKYGDGYVSQSEGLDLGDTCTGVLGSLDCVQTPKEWNILPPVISAQFITKDHFFFIYGVVEIRARLPRGDWIYPEIYLKSKNDYYGQGLDSGLIRIAFAPGNADSSRILSGGCVLGPSVAARHHCIRTIRSDSHWTYDFHVYRLEWKPDSITLSVDDQIYGNVYPPDTGFANQAVQLGIEKKVADRWRKGTIMAPFDQEMYLALGVGAGGQCFPDRTDGTKPWNNNDPKAQLNFYRKQDVWNRTWNDDTELLVDYVKIWAL